MYALLKISLDIRSGAVQVDVFGVYETKAEAMAEKRASQYAYSEISSGFFTVKKVKY